MDRADRLGVAVGVPVDRSREVSQARRSGVWRGSWQRAVKGPAQLFHSLAGLLVRVDSGRGASAGVQDRGVVASTEVPSDGGQRFAGELACEVHGELARPCDPRGAGAGGELLGREVEELTGGALDVGDGAGAPTWVDSA